MKIIYIAVLILLVLILIFALLIYKESKEFCVTFYQYTTEKIKKDSFRIVMLSDLHDKVFGEQNMPLIDAIDELNPDIIVFGGDMVTSSMELKYDYTSTIDFIHRLADRYPIYYGMGNHEEKFRRCEDRFPGKYEELVKRLHSFGVHIMDNECCTIEAAGINIYGLTLEHEYYRRVITKHIPADYMEKIFGRLDQDRYHILLAHNPEQFKGYAGWEPDLVFSGHIHGGIMQLPLLGGVVSPQLKLFPKYDAGEFKEANTTMLLSRGIGSHTVPIRIANRAEILCVTLKKKKSEHK